MPVSTQCASCGFNNPPGMKFCGNCGARLLVVSGLLASASPPAATTSPALSSEKMGVMMGADLLERFRQAGLEAAGQRRNVTVLFADITGYTELSQRLDPEETYTLIQRFSQLLASDVYKYEGMVDKFTGDGLMALFGAPIAHENNAERAVRAALDMLADVATLAEDVREHSGVELRVRIGLNSGSVVVGSVGSNLLMNYTAIGNTVNLASRLEQAAQPGTVLVSDSVYRFTKPLVEYQPVGPLLLKGITAPVSAHWALALKAKPDSLRGVEGLRAPMIGRDAELAQLNQALTTLTRHKRGQLILLTGEAGMGKSRLVAEFKGYAGQTSARLLDGQSLTYRRAVPYWIFLDLLRNYLGVSADATDVHRRAALRRVVVERLGLTAPETLAYLEYLLSLEPSDPAFADRLPQLEPSHLRQQIFLAVREVLVAEAKLQPLILILEDLHWADETSLELLNFLLDSIQLAPLCLQAVARPLGEGPLTQLLATARRRFPDRLTVLHLQSLSLEQSEQLLLQLLNLTNLPAVLREPILQRAAGVPFYLEEVLRMLVDARIIQPVGDQWQLTPGVDVSTLGVPDTLQDLILTRFDQLNASQRRALQVAAVIGRYFSWALMNAVVQPLNPASLQSVLTQLVEREFIRPRADAPETEYEFKQVLVSDAIYGTLLKRERGELHGQVGAAIETVYANQLEGQIELLARHYSWSPRLDRALHYLLLAGQKAARDYANVQARQNFEQALGFLPQVEHDPEQALQIRMGLGDVLVFVGEYQAARTHYQTALDLLPPHQARERSMLARKISTTYQRLGDLDQALASLALAQTALADAPQSLFLERAQILNELGWINFQRGQFVEAEQYLREALQLAEPDSAPDTVASIHNRLGAVAFETGRLAEAAEQVRRALALREQLGDTAGVARLYNNLGMMNWRQGQWQAALENYTRSLKLMEQLGDADGIALGYLNRGILLCDQGQAEAAQRDLEASLERAGQTGNSYYRARALMNLGRLWLGLEAWAKAVEPLTESERLFAEMGARDTQVDALLLQSEVFIGQGEWPKANAKMAEATALLPPSEQGKNDQHGRLMRQHGMVALQTGKLVEAERALLASAELFNQLGDTFEKARTDYQLARLAQSNHDVALAQHYAHEAQQTFLALGAQREAERCARLMKAVM